MNHREAMRPRASSEKSSKEPDPEAVTIGSGIIVDMLLESPIALNPNLLGLELFLP